MTTPTNNMKTTAVLTGVEAVEAKETGIADKAAAKQQTVDVGKAKVANRTFILEMFFILVWVAIRAYCIMMLIRSPKEIYKSLYSVRTGLALHILCAFLWVLSLFNRWINYRKMSERQKNSPEETVVKEGTGFRSVITRYQILTLLVLIVVEGIFYLLEKKYIAIPGHIWLLSDIPDNLEDIGGFVVSGENTEDPIHSELSKLISKEYLANNPGVSVETILNQSPIDIARDKFVASPECSEISDYDTCVKGRTNVCEKRTPNECLTDDFCIVEGGKCIPNEVYSNYDTCTYIFNDDDVCTSIDENSDGIWYDFMGEEYDTGVYIDKCGTGGMKNLCEIIDKDPQLLDKLREDIEGVSIDDISVFCNGGGTINMCIGKSKSLSGDSDWAREYQATTGAGENINIQDIILDATEYGVCSDLIPTPIKDGDNFDYKCLRSSDDPNQNVGKYCKITNTSDSNQCVPKYVGLSKEEGKTYYTVVESESCNQMPPTQHDKISAHVKEYGGEDEDKNIIKCSENFPLRHGSFDSSPDGKFAEMIEALKQDTTNASTSFYEDNKQILYPYVLLRNPDSDPDELLTFYQDILDPENAPYKNTTTDPRNAPSDGSLASAKKITEAHQTIIKDTPQSLFSTSGDQAVESTDADAQP